MYGPRGGLRQIHTELRRLVVPHTSRVVSPRERSFKSQIRYTSISNNASNRGSSIGSCLWAILQIDFWHPTPAPMSYAQYGNPTPAESHLHKRKVVAFKCFRL